jgi:hypothetical protein
VQGSCALWAGAMRYVDELRIDGVLGSSGASFVLWGTYCAGAQTYAPDMSMLRSLRGTAEAA